MTAAAGAAAFPWGEIIALGLGVLRLPPQQFWSMTLCEFRFLCAGAAPMRQALRLDRAGLDRLMQLYPDHTARRGP